MEHTEMVRALAIRVQVAALIFGPEAAETEDAREMEHAARAREVAHRFIHA